MACLVQGAPRLSRRCRLLLGFTTLLIILCILINRDPRQSAIDTMYQREIFRGTLRQALWDMLTIRAQTIIYNKIPKCASATVSQVLRLYGESSKTGSRLLDCQLQHSNKYRRLSTHTALLQKLLDFLRHQQEPYVYEQHMDFLDFEQFNAYPKLYINVLRAPLERLSSEYRFHKSMSLKSDEFDMPKDTRFKREMDDMFGRSTEYFCGQHRACAGSHTWALQTAMSNVRRHYLLVGTVDLLPQFFEVLEFMLPLQFGNLTNFYKGLGKRLPQYNQMKNTNQFSSALVEKLNVTLYSEHYFYNFIRKRFRKVYDFMKYCKTRGWDDALMVTKKGSVDDLLKLTNFLPMEAYLEQS